MTHKVRGSTKIAQALTRIAKAHELDLTQVGTTVSAVGRDYRTLVITVKGPDLVEAGYWEQDKNAGKPLADPAVLYFTGQPDLGWIPLESRNDYVDEHIVAATVVQGHVTVSDPTKLKELLQHSDSWSSNLKHWEYASSAVRRT